jgi:Chaperone of endosialidase
MSNRSTLKSFFTTAARPNQTQFADLIDSTASLAESNSGTLTLTGAIVVGNTSALAVPGAIKWNGTNFEFHTGAGFQTLTFGGGAITNPLNIGNLRVGSDLGGGTLCVFAHNLKYNTSDFALSQTAAGATTVNSTTVLTLRNGATTALTAQAGVVTMANQVIIGTPPGGSPAIPGGTTLAVYGEAMKLTGAAWAVMSDVRVKKDIHQFDEGLDKLMQVNPVRFKYNGVPGVNTETNEQVGIVAQEIRKVFPYMSEESKAKPENDQNSDEGLLMFNSGALQFVMINAIKELNERLMSLEKSIIKEN